MAPDTGPPYALPYPNGDAVADVPADLMALAAKLTTVLDGKLPKDDVKTATSIYQKKIKVVTSVPGSGAGYDEGDIIFVVA